MKYKSKKGTVINIPDGLSAKDIAAIKKDADNGYGTRAQATADKLGKKKQQEASKPADAPQAVDNSQLVDEKTGAIDTEKTLEAVRISGNQTITDQNGNKRTIRTDPNTGEVTVVDEAGGTSSKFKDLAEAAASTFNGSVSRQAAYDADFGQRTKYLDRNMERDQTNAKQELANRGIPYNPNEEFDSNSKNLYGRTLGGIRENYAEQYKGAADAATISGNQAFATDAAARDSFIAAATNGATSFGGQYTPFQGSGSQDTKDVTALSSAAFLAKYGMDKEAWSKAQALKKSGGGGGGGAAPAAGFEILS